ncbi:BRISC and BRCA1-A complex member 1 isoform X2 [Engystomops pustulosus]|uniref:BRISC and BRCA1-A complex member 1 isoform X2 n=1 Tax=Engystomops pustulosus TaxID=76066 RepID=UPI003AFA0DD0
MDTSEPTEDGERTLEQRPRTRSNPEGAEDRGAPPQPIVGSRSEGEGEAAQVEEPPQAVMAPPSCVLPPPVEFQVKTPRVNCPEKVLSGFTSDPREVCSCLYDLETNVCESFNLEGLFNLIQQRTEFPVTDNVQTIPPPYVVRIILIYSRPASQPSLTLTETMKKMLQCPYFFFDVVYIHNGSEEEDVSWKDVFGFFSSLDTKCTSYKYEVSITGPALELHNCMARLLAHPLQRPFQSHASYSLLDEEEEIAEGEVTV